MIKTILLTGFSVFLFSNNQAFAEDLNKEFEGNRYINESVSNYIELNGIPNNSQIIINDAKTAENVADYIYLNGIPDNTTIISGDRTVIINNGQTPNYEPDYLNRVYYFVRSERSRFCRSLSQYEKNIRISDDIEVSCFNEISKLEIDYTHDGKHTELIYLLPEYDIRDFCGNILYHKRPYHSKNQRLMHTCYNKVKRLPYTYIY